MTDDPPGLILTCLRRIDTKIDAPAEEVRDLKLRVTSLEPARPAACPASTS